MQILLISSVLPENTSGGSLILYRHFSRWPDLELIVATDQPEVAIAKTVIPTPAYPYLSRWQKTRLARWVQDFTQSWAIAHDPKPLQQYLTQHRPDLILTVAHGDLAWLALRLAQTHQIPLATIFHDWWPDLAFVHAPVRRLVTRRFYRLYQQSDLALCVSESMQRELGPHPNTQVLFPIPETAQMERAIAPATPCCFNVVYAGNLSDIYGPMVQQLCQVAQASTTWQLKLFGPTPDWPEAQVAHWKATGIYGGFLTREHLIQELQQADAILVILSFAPQDRQRMQTSFPSKLVDYCQFGKPLLIWGPATSAAIRWHQTYQVGWGVTSASAQALDQAIQQLVLQPQVQQLLAQRALAIAQDIFCPEQIQQQWMTALSQLTRRN